MKLKDLNDNQRFYTGKASDINRQLILAGIAIIWIFRTTSQNGVTFLKTFTILPLLTFTLAAVLDLVQYVYSGYAWKQYLLKTEQDHKKNNIKDGDVEVPLKIPKTAERFYWAKIVCTVVSYILLLIFLIKELGSK